MPTPPTIRAADDQSKARKNAAPRVLHGTNELLSHFSGWTAAQLSLLDPMQQPAWISAWTASFGSAESLRAVMVDGPSGPVAVMPLVERRRGVCRWEQLGLRELAEPMGLLVGDPSRAEVAAEGLVRLGRPLLFERLWADTPLIEALRCAGAGRGWLAVRPRASVPRIALDASWKNPESRLNSKRRSDMRRARRRAEELGPITVDVLAPNEQELGPLLDEAYRVEAAGWKGKAQTALQTQTQFGDFFRGYATALSRTGLLRLAFLRVAEQVVAMQLAVEANGGYWLMKIGYDESFARCSPGMLLTLETIRYAAEHGLASYEFLGRDEEWTQIWTRDTRPCSALMYYPCNVPGLLALAWDAGRALTLKAGHGLARLKIGDRSREWVHEA